MMVGRYKSNLDVVDFIEAWPANVKERWEGKIVRAEGHSQKVDLFLTVLAPVCVGSATTRRAPSSVRSTKLFFPTLKQIPSLDDATRQKIHTLLMNMDYFHTGATLLYYILRIARNTKVLPRRREAGGEKLRAFLT